MCTLVFSEVGRWWDYWWLLFFISFLLSAFTNSYNRYVDGNNKKAKQNKNSCRIVGIRDFPKGPNLWLRKNFSALCKMLINGCSWSSSWDFRTWDRGPGNRGDGAVAGVEEAATAGSESAGRRVRAELELRRRLSVCVIFLRSLQLSLTTPSFPGRVDGSLFWLHRLLSEKFFTVGPIHWNNPVPLSRGTWVLWETEPSPQC